MSPFEQLQNDLTAWLLGNPATAAVPYALFRKEVIEDVAAEKQAGWTVRVDGKVGLNCLILMPSAKVKDPNVPGPQLELEIVIRTFCDPKVNNTGLSCEEVALQNLSWCDGIIIEDLTELHGSADTDALKPVYDYPGFVVYDSVLRGPLPQSSAGSTMAPTFTDDGASLVTIACADSAAAIYFALGTDSIQPGNADQLYSAPVHVDNGAIIRALAWNTAKLPSSIAKGIINFNS